MSKRKILSSLSNLALLALIALLLPIGGAAAEPYDLILESENFEPGQAVAITVTGPVNMTFSLRITVDEGNIVAGRDATLDATGKYVYSWTPSSEGDFNVTVVYATGFGITKQLLIQEKVTDIDIAQIYVTLFGIRDRQARMIEEVRTLSIIAVALGAMSLAISAAVGIYIYRNIPHRQTELERFIQEQVLGVIKAQQETIRGLKVENKALKEPK